MNRYDPDMVSIILPFSFNEDGMSYATWNTPVYVKQSERQFDEALHCYRPHQICFTHPQELKDHTNNGGTVHYIRGRSNKDEGSILVQFLISYLKMPNAYKATTVHNTSATYRVYRNQGQREIAEFCPANSKPSIGIIRAETEIIINFASLQYRLAGMSKFKPIPSF
jgi:hypothetical protein